MKPTQFESQTRRSADYRFLIFAPGVVENVTVPDWLRRDPHILDVGITAQPGDTIHPLRSTSDRAGFLVSTGETLDEAVQRADRACREILVRYTNGAANHAAELLEFQEFTHS